MEETVKEKQVKAQELRIGNLIFNDRDEVIEVEQIQYMDDDVPYKKELGEFAVNQIAITIYKGIPITEEWLSKFGFEKKGPFKWDKDELSNYVMKYPNACRYGDDQVNLLYVHQLQNLCFALTGEELTLSPL